MSGYANTVVAALEDRSRRRELSPAEAEGFDLDDADMELTRSREAVRHRVRSGDPGLVDDALALMVGGRRAPHRYGALRFDSWNLSRNDATRRPARARLEARS